MTHSWSFDRASDELHWFLEPTAGPDDHPLSPIRPEVGAPKQSVVNKALDGDGPYPTDALGDPIIRTLGSLEEGCSGYNPPETCRVILAALERVDPLAWEAHVPFRCELYRRALPEVDPEDIAGFVADELSAARDTFPVLVSAYSRAVERGYGVSCEYSL
jgi:hypothetical protein